MTRSRHCRRCYRDVDKLYHWKGFDFCIRCKRELLYGISEPIIGRSFWDGLWDWGVRTFHVCYDFIKRRPQIHYVKAPAIKADPGLKAKLNGRQKTGAVKC